jgi:hypothetical protein
MKKYKIGQRSAKTGWARLRLIDEIVGEEKVVTIVSSFYKVLKDDGTLGYRF